MTVATLALLAVVAAGAYVVYQRCLSPLAHVPGPFWASLSRLWLARLGWVGGQHALLPALHARHGPLVRIAPDEVSVADPAAIKHIYAAGTKFRKAVWYSVWQGRRRFDLFPERNEHVHAAQRRLVSRPYSIDALAQLEPHVNGAMSLFLARLDQSAGRSVDLGQWVQLLAFDVIGEITFSRRFGFLDAGADDGSFAHIASALRSASWAGQLPDLYWLNDLLTPYLGNRLAVAHRHGSLRDFAVREVTSRVDRGSDHADMLAMLLQTHRDKPKEMDMTAVMSMAASNIFAGSDTTAISMRAVIYHLLRNPPHLARLVAEIDAMADAGDLAEPVTLDQAKRMPFLNACLWEGLRVHPAVGMTMPRTVPEGGFDVCGTFLPAGYTIGANAWVIHRDTSIFGPDAASFNPERWLHGDTGNMHRHLLTFGAGARLCLGKNISWMEMSKLIPTLFRRYHVRLTHPEKEWELTSWWFVVQKGLDVVLTRRNLPVPV